MILGAIAQAALGQSYVYSPAPPVVPGGPVAAPAYTPDQLDQMLGPVALYPDPLLSEVLAAATYPQDVSAAAQWLQYHPNPSDNEIAAQGWDPSVQAISRFPDLVRMMADNMDWTEALGSAFASQEAAVMDAVQRLRGRAYSAHTLVSTPQQEVVQEDGAIDIYPAQPEVIYLPEYDPAVVYVPTVAAAPLITFGPACPFGGFFDLGFDFPHHRFLRGVQFDRDRHRFDFARAAAWEHDRNRPIPVAHRQFTAPRGWHEAGHGASAFRPGQPDGRAPAEARRGTERPVTGLPAQRNEPRREAPPQHAAPAPQQRPAPVPVPARPAPQPAAPPRNERPVNGLPARPAPAPRTPPPAQRPAPPPAQRTAPPTAQRSAPPPARSPAFHPGGADGAASARGHGSMHR